MLRCRRCRKEIIDSTSLLAGEDTHENPATVCSIWHVNVDALPEWILTLVHQAQWTVGKLNCRKCSARLGGFDFIHYFECPCGQDAAIHLNKSRVDPEPNQCYPMAQPRMQKPAEAHRNLLMTESQRQDSEWNKAKLTCSHPNDATAISNSAVTSNSLSASENISLFSFSPLYCIRKRKPRRLEDSSAVQSSGCCSAAPVDKPSTRLTSADTDERLHASRAAAPRLDAAREASVIVSSLVPARRLSRARHLVQQPLEVDVSPAETSAVHEDVQRACPLSFPFVTEGEQQVRTEAAMGSLASSKLSKREKNRLKGLRRKQRKKERWLDSKLEKESEEEEEEGRECLTCAVCLDIYICPHACRPCGHSFCEPCLRTIANSRPMNTPCPLCRTLISHTNFNKELDRTAQAFFPKVYGDRERTFKSAACAKWPLPSTGKNFCAFWREQRRVARTLGHWRFHHHGNYSLAFLGQTNMQAGLFDICLLILYICSANWILLLLSLLVLVYYFWF